MHCTPLKMIKIVNNKLSIVNRRGAALLVVLFIIMAITILSLGFLSRSDVELACGQNMILRTQMDYLAESGLEHAKGLILNPQDVDSEYWTGATGQQLVEGSNDYYDVRIVRDDNETNDYCKYNIECDSYRQKGVETVGRSSLKAKLRLDPCIALWTGSDTTLWSGVTINGDVRCGGTLTNQGAINGDVFGSLTGTDPEGQKYFVGELSLDWPPIDVIDFKDRSDVVDYRPSSSTLTGNVSINRMLLVKGDLTVSGTNNVIIARKNLPALYVTGDLIIEKGASLNVTGLAVVDRDVRIVGDTNFIINGGLFVYRGIVQTANDSSGSGNTGTLYGPIRSVDGGHTALRFDGTDDYAQIENESVFDITSQITVAAWIKVNAFNRNFQAIATKGDSAWRIQRWSNTNRIEFACTGLPHNQYGNITGNISVNDGQWHHVAGVYDGTRIYLYIDGVLDVSLPTSGSINTNNYKVMIGENAQMRPSQNRCWNGWIDDVRVYNRGLSAVEINTIKAGGATSGLIAHWMFDEANPNVIITAAPTKTAVLLGPQDAQQCWGQAAGAFFRSIQRR